MVSDGILVWMEPKCHVQLATTIMQKSGECSGVLNKTFATF